MSNVNLALGQGMFCCKRSLSTKILSTSLKCSPIEPQSTPKTSLNQTTFRHKIHSYLVQARYLSDTNQSSSYNCDTNANSNDSSSYHQRYRRDSYERKRANFDSQNGAQNPVLPRSVAKVTHYERLNVDPKADLDAIKSAYYSLSKVYHPDVVSESDEGASEKFRLITESYDTLSDPKLRIQYDKQLEVTETLKYHQPVWRPQSMNQNMAIKTKDADRVFRMKQDSAMERERALNPNKFRSGTFRVDDVTDESIDRRIGSIERRLHILGGDQSKQQDFYSVFMRKALVHQKNDLLRARHLGGHRTGRVEMPVEMMKQNIYAALVLIVSLLFIIVTQLKNFSLSDYLDKRLKLAIEERKNAPD